MRAVLLTLGVLSSLLAAGIVCVTQPLVVPVPSTPPGVDPVRLEQHVRRLSVDLYPRSYDQPRKIGLAADYIASEFRRAGALVSTQDVEVEEATYKNVIARFGPKSGPVIVIGAHYDSHADTHSAAIPRKGYSLETHTPGADDNASGVAALIELAYLLGGKPQTRSIELVAYALEEPPHFRTEHMGSVWHARDLVRTQREVQLMLALEMLGYFSDKPGSQSYPLPGMSGLYSDRGDFIALIGGFGDFGAMRQAKALMSGATNLPVYSINAPAFIPGIDFSDHRSFWSNGTPAIMVTDTAFYRNRNYHLATDTYDNLDYFRMAEVVRAVYAITQRLPRGG